jgi:hypothetical protein
MPSRTPYTDYVFTMFACSTTLGRTCALYILFLVPSLTSPRDTNYTDHDQLSLILDVLGTPSIDDFYAISSPRSREYIRALPFRRGRDFKTMFQGANELVCVRSICENPLV